MEFTNPNINATPPSFLLDIWHQGTDILIQYGWYILFLTLMTVYYWPSIRRYLDQSYKDRTDKEYAAKCKKDPDWLYKRQTEMEAARKRMQEDLNAKAALNAAKELEKVEREAEQKRAAASKSGGYRLGSEESKRPTEETKGTSSASKKKYRPEYNPLMGSGGSGGYRPPRRGCPGGGCG